jgi:hypothetical protein
MQWYGWFLQTGTLLVEATIQVSLVIKRTPGETHQHIEQEGKTQSKLI